MLVLGDVYVELGRFQDARAVHERCVALFGKAAPGHADLAVARAHLGRTLLRMGRVAAAGAELDGALAIAGEQLTGPRHAVLLLGLGELLLARGEHAQAVAELERALRIASPDRRPLIQATLARALWAGGDRARALDAARAARDQYRRAGNRSRLAEVETWLARSADSVSQP